MPEKFEFNEKPAKVSLDLCGRRYSVALDEDTNQKCREMLDGARQRLELLCKGIKCEETSDEEICKFLCAGLDNLLGEGAVSEVFGDRTVNLEDVAQLICYVLSELRAAE